MFQEKPVIPKEPAGTYKPEVFWLPLVSLTRLLLLLLQNGNNKYHPPLVYLLNPFGNSSRFALGFAPCLSTLRAGDPGVTAAGQNSGNNNNCAVLAQEGGRLFSAFAAHDCWYK